MAGIRPKGHRTKRRTYGPMTSPMIAVPARPFGAGNPRRFRLPLLGRYSVECGYEGESPLPKGGGNNMKDDELRALCRGLLLDLSTATPSELGYDLPELQGWSLVAARTKGAARGTTQEGFAVGPDGYVWRVVWSQKWGRWCLVPAAQTEGQTPANLDPRLARALIGLWLDLQQCESENGGESPPF